LSNEWIDPELCNGCGICVNACSQDVIRMDDETKKPVIKYPEDCTRCRRCEFDCPENAIHVSPERTARPLAAW
jgi:NAD-dependent dihydropyrimidine dehydrogenase PreA subunit